MINCREIANDIKRELKAEISDLRRFDPPTLAIIQVGYNEASRRYVIGKIKDCLDVGIAYTLYKKDEDVTETELLATIDLLNDLSYIHGIIVQLPLPKHLDEEKIVNRISPSKDVDGFTPNSPFTPCTPLGVLTLLDKLDIDVKGDLITLVGYGKLVNKPLFQLLSDRGATVAVCRSNTPKRILYQLCRLSDIIITAVGKHGIIDHCCIDDYYPPIVIDCGIEVIDGKQYGDCDTEVYDSIYDVTPRVGGMGLMTRVSLLQNVVKAYRLQEKL